MLSALLVLIFMLLLALAWGNLAERALERFFKNEPEMVLPLPIRLILGISLCIGVTRIIHFFHAVDLWLLLVNVVLIITQAKYIKTTLFTILRSCKESPASAITFIAFVLLAILNVGSRPLPYDTGTYHLQAIKWVENYSIVPGLANLIRQLGFNSNWFIWQALTGGKHIGLPSLYTANAFLYLVVCAGFIHELNRAKNIFPVLGFLLALVVIGSMKYVGSVSPDLPVLLLTAYCIWFYYRGRKEQLANPLVSAFITVLPLFLITIKISAVPVVAITILQLVHHYKTHLFKPLLALCFITGIFWVVPWIAGNIILSGYIVFPSELLDVFNFDWKVPDFLIIDEHHSIKGWARVPYQDSSVIAEMSATQWIPLWWKQLAVYNKITGIAGFVLFLYMLIKKESTRTTLIPIGIGIAFWFINAPDFRFVYGYLLPLTALFFEETNWHISFVQTNQKVLKITSGILTLMIIGFVYQQKKNIELVKPLPYPTPDKERIPINGTFVLFPTWEEKCWDAPLPCTCEYYKGLELRGSTVNSGFRIRASGTK
jgi:hypothetical protein